MGVKCLERVSGLEKILECCSVVQVAWGFILFTLEINDNMNMHITKKEQRVRQYRYLPLLLLPLLFFTDAYADQTTFQEGHYRVRQTGETCKLEVFLESKSLNQSKSKFWKHDFSNETIGFFSVFKTDDYFGELITEKARIGLAKGKFSVQFDGVTDESVASSDSTGADNLWRWRHFSYGKGILNRIKRGRTMEVSFSNGKNMFHFNIPLAGSSKAVKHLKRCKGR